MKPASANRVLGELVGRRPLETIINTTIWTAAGVATKGDETLTAHTQQLLEASLYIGGVVTLVAGLAKHHLWGSEVVRGSLRSQEEPG